MTVTNMTLFLMYSLGLTPVSFNNSHFYFIIHLVVEYHIKIDTRTSVNRIEFIVVDGSMRVTFSSLYQLHRLCRTKLQSDLRIGSDVEGCIRSTRSLNAIHKQSH